MSDIQSHIRNTLRMEKLYDVRPGMSEVDPIVNKASSSTYRNLARLAVDLENQFTRDRLARSYRKRMSCQQLLDTGILIDADVRNSLTAQASSSLSWNIKADAVAKTLRYRLTKQQLEDFGIIKHLQDNANALQWSMVEARIQRMLRTRISPEQLRNINFARDPLHGARHRLEFNRNALSLKRLLGDRQSLIDLQVAGVVKGNTFQQHDAARQVLEKKLRARPTREVLENRQILGKFSVARALEAGLIRLQLESKLVDRPTEAQVAHLRPALHVDGSLAASSLKLEQSFNKRRLQKSLDTQPSRVELQNRNIIAEGDPNLAAVVKALERARTEDRLNSLIRDMPERDALVAKGIMVEPSYPRTKQQEAKALEFELTRLRLKSHIKARETLFKLHDVPIENDFVIVSCA